MILFLLVFFSIIYVHEYVHYAVLRGCGAEPTVKVKKVFKLLPAPSLHVDDGEVSKKQSVAALLALVVPVAILYGLVLNAYAYGVLYAAIHGVSCSLLASGFDMYNTLTILTTGEGI
ncbi:hypothetical protein AKJ62_01390 [candidate division MSBL1 archaeon SCGC-AAA259D14]|uniref:Uncharacterized protein n=1 Tax=candidate division MSBL1 archaeon SCGC-AAA259D14 TaxID=1698261 RepID=A0A133U7P2_9EURY|nr:hypothetical protein AKJ62_01390 [candidate division MSBL1 archaeon SCGC-AAA259D14]